MIGTYEAHDKQIVILFRWLSKNLKTSSCLDALKRNGLSPVKVINIIVNDEELLKNGRAEKMTPKKP
jgi:hypothetical protein